MKRAISTLLPSGGSVPGVSAIAPVLLTRATTAPSATRVEIMHLNAPIPNKESLAAVPESAAPTVQILDPAAPREESCTVTKIDDKILNEVVAAVFDATSLVTDAPMETVVPEKIEQPSEQGPTTQQQQYEQQEYDYSCMEGFEEDTVTSDPRFYNGLDTNALFPVPISSFDMGIWSPLINTSYPGDFTVNPFARMPITVTELLYLTLPPVDATCMTGWPIPFEHYTHGLGPAGETHGPAGQHVFPKPVTAFARSKVDESPTGTAPEAEAEEVPSEFWGGETPEDVYTNNGAADYPGGANAANVPLLISSSHFYQQEAMMHQRAALMHAHAQYQQARLQSEEMEALAAYLGYRNGGPGVGAGMGYHPYPSMAMAPTMAGMQHLIPSLGAPYRGPPMNNTIASKGPLEVSAVQNNILRGYRS